MTFGESISICMKKYVVFDGRASRSEFWWFMLFCSVVPGILGYLNEILGILAFLALLLPQVSVGVRRMHDLDKTGWLLAITLIPLIGQLILLYWCVQPGTPGSNQFGEPDS